MPNRLKFHGLALVLASLSLAGCGETSRSPAEVVVAAVMAANEGLYSEANQHLSDASLRMLEEGARLWGSAGQDFWDRRTREGTIERVEILDEQLRGEGATVEFRVHYEDGRTTEPSLSLIKEDDGWKSDLAASSTL